MEEAANLAGVPNLSQKGTRVGNWLTREQAKELLTVPDRSKIKGKRDLRDFWRCCWAALCGGRRGPLTRMPLLFVFSPKIFLALSLDIVENIYLNRGFPCRPH